jgi:hypothetical protein
VDCGLITKKQGPLCKIGLNFWLRFIFQSKKHILGPWLMDQCREQSTVDLPPWPATELDGARPHGRSRAWWLTGGGATGRGVHEESILGLTGAQAAVWRPGDGGEDMVEEVLGAGGTWAWREEKESGERCGGGRWGCPFI